MSGSVNEFTWDGASRLSVAVSDITRNYLLGKKVASKYCFLNILGSE